MLQYPVKITIIINFVFLFFSVLYIILARNTANKYFSFGWRNDLVLFDIDVTNPTSYFLIVFILIGLSVFEVLRDCYTDPWLYNTIYDINIKKISDHSKISIIILVMMDCSCEIATKAMDFNAFTVQIDFLFWIAGSKLFCQFFVLGTYINQKEFENEFTIIPKRYFTYYETFKLIIEKRFFNENKQEQITLNEEEKYSTNKNFDLENYE